MAASRKLYVEIANIISDTLDEQSVQDAYAAVDEIATRLSTLFETENPNFDRDKFLKACGVS